MILLKVTQTINYLINTILPTFKDEQLLLAKDDPIMQEVCEFDILIINEAYKEISQNKTMSIYEALKFVKHTMEHIKAF